MENRLLVEVEEEYSPIARLIELGRQKKYVTFDDILHFFPEAEKDIEQLEEAFSALLGAGVAFIENTPASEAPENELAAVEPRTCRRQPIPPRPPRRRSPPGPSAWPAPRKSHRSRRRPWCSRGRSCWAHSARPCRRIHPPRCPRATRGTGSGRPCPAAQSGTTYPSRRPRTASPAGCGSCRRAGRPARVHGQVAVGPGGICHAQVIAPGIPIDAIVLQAIRASLDARRVKGDDRVDHRRVPGNVDPADAVAVLYTIVLYAIVRVAAVQWSPPPPLRAVFPQPRCWQSSPSRCCRRTRPHHGPRRCRSAYCLKWSRLAQL